MTTAVREEVVQLGPNSAQQSQALASPAQVLVVGGQAGGGKSRFLLMDPTRFIYPHEGCRRSDSFSAVIFRRTMPQVTNEGGLWDESVAFYSNFPDAVMVPGDHEWRWPKDRWDRGPFPTLRFAHLQHEDTVYSWQGSQVPWMGFDEGTHFTGKQFWYMLSRNRSMTGIVGQMRVSCNPDPDSFIAELVDWYIDNEEEIKIRGKWVANPHYGIAIPERSGVIRYFFKLGDDFFWSEKREDLYKHLPRPLPDGVTEKDLIKSFSFVPFKLADNKDLLRTNPQYLANLLAQDEVERERLLGGNWKVRPKAGKVLPRAKVEVLPTIMVGALGRVRYWDKAAGADEESDWTVGVRMARYPGNLFIVEDVVREQVTTAEREELIYQVAQTDGEGIPIAVEQEPGSGGKDSAYWTITGLAGWDVMADRPSKDLYSRTRPLASQWQVGNVKIVSGLWNAAYLSETNAYDGSESTATRKDDQVAASAGAFNYLMYYAEEGGNPDDYEETKG